MRNLIALAAFAIAAACAPSNAPTPVQAAPASTPAAPAPSVETQAPAPIADETSCKTAGGDWRPICRMQKPACVITYKDAGKSCTDGSQCEGDCIAEVTTGAASAGQPATGKCSTNSDPCGCKTFVTDGKASATLCAD